MFGEDLVKTVRHKDLTLLGCRMPVYHGFPIIHQNREVYENVTHLG